MNEVTVKKDELVTKITENRAGHRKIFEEAIEGYKKEGVRLLEEHIARIKSGSLERVYVSLPEPADHTGDYDRVLAMLKMSVDEEVEISERSFAAYVLDDWDWKQTFLQTNSAYSVTAAASLR